MSDTDQSDGPSGSPQVSTYRVPKIPPFWRNNPETWFMQVEATSRISNCKTDRTKADYLISALDSEIVDQVGDLISENPPATGYYQSLKDRILSIFSILPEARLRQLLKGQTLGDRKPSQLLNHMRKLNGGQCNPTVLKSLFLEQLPESQRAILVAMNEPDLQKVAEIADKIADISSPELALAPIRVKSEKAKTHQSDTNVQSDSEKQIAEIIKRLTSIENKVAKLKRERSTSRSHSKSKQHDAQNSDAKSGYCFIHQKYGKKATFCRKPCSWKDDEKSEN